MFFLDHIWIIPLLPAFAARPASSVRPWHKVYSTYTGERNSQ